MFKIIKKYATIAIGISFAGVALTYGYMIAMQLFSIALGKA